MVQLYFYIEYNSIGTKKEYFFDIDNLLMYGFNFSNKNIKIINQY